MKTLGSKVRQDLLRASAHVHQKTDACTALSAASDESVGDMGLCPLETSPADQLHWIRSAWSFFTLAWNVDAFQRKCATFIALSVFVISFSTNTHGQDAPQEQIHPPQVVKNIQLNAISGIDSEIAPFEEATDISIGSKDDLSRLSLNRRYSEPNSWGDYYRPFGVKFGHNFDYRMYCHIDDFESHVCNDFSTPLGSVSLDGSGYHDGNILDVIGGGQTIEWKLWTKDSALIEFDYQNSMAKASCSAPDCYMAKSVTFPNGEKISFEYERALGSETIYSARLRRAVSNRGYALKFYYESAPTTTLYAKVFYISKVESIKLDCTSSPCAEKVVSSVSYQYKYTAPNSIGNVLGHLIGFRDSEQNLTSYEYFSESTGYQGRLIAVKRPANPNVPIYQNTFGPAPNGFVITQTNPMGVSSTFTSNHSTYGENIITEQQGPQTNTYKVVGTTYGMHGGYTNWSVKSITRTNNAVTVYNYDQYGRVIGMVQPEGDSISLELDDIGNVTKETRTAKPGSSDDPIITQWKYMPCGSNRLLCHRVEYKIDPKGGRTDYTWNSRGELETIRHPADSVGMRPQDDYSYTSYTGIDGSQIYLVSSITTKIDATHSTTTTFAYDSAAGFSLREKIVDGVLRSCFRTDDAGNVISETTPRSGGCP